MGSSPRCHSTRQKREIQKDLQIQGPYGSIRRAKTCSPNLTKYCENAERHNDLKPLTQYQEAHQLYLQVSCAGYPGDVPLTIYILFIFAAA
jgi:hypothetical protein